MGSRIGHSLGQAVFDAIIDEANFEVIGGQAYENFNSILRRMESRFMQPGGGVAGKIWIVSSESDKSSTVNTIVDSYRKAKGVYVSQAPLWQVKSERYGSKRFWVYCGSDLRPPEVLYNDLSLLEREPENCIEVPEEHRESFEANLHDSLRDLAGRSTSSSYRLFRLRDRLFKSLSVTPLFPDIINLDFDNDDDQISNYILMPGYFKNPLNKAIPRYIHVDIGLTGDRLGIAASYVSGYRTRKARDINTFETIEESVPEFVTEWCIGIEPSPGKQVPLFKIRMFIQWLSIQGYPISKITFDGYNSADSIQQLIKMGFSSELLSVDKTVDPYISLRSAVYENRAFLPNNKLLKKELEHLEVSPDGEKIDHPDKFEDGTKAYKDVSDGVCGSTYNAMVNSSRAKLFHLVQAAEASNTGSEIKRMFWPNFSGE